MQRPDPDASEPLQGLANELRIRMAGNILQAIKHLERRRKCCHQVTTNVPHSAYSRLFS
ncbi:MAG: hypothetical protein ABI680_20770 [Chthoniobacteraceae bacterium]